MALDDDVALGFLVYLLLPIVVLLILWLVWLVAYLRRRASKKDDVGGEESAETEG